LLLAFGSPLGGLSKEIVEVIAHGELLAIDFWACLGDLPGSGTRSCGTRTRDALPHFRIGSDVPEFVVIHDLEFPLFQGIGDRDGNVGFSSYDFSAAFFDFRDHLLFDRDGFGSTAFRPGPGDPSIGFGPVGLQAGADVFADVDVRDVDGDNFEGGLIVESAFEYFFRNQVGILQHDLVAIRRPDSGHDPLSDSGDDRLLGRTTDQSLQVRAHGDASFDLQLDSIFGDCIQE
jgi:hypothetical protein